MQTAQKEQKIVNGVNVTELFETIDAIGGNKEIAKFNFRASNKWINGGQNETVVDDYDGACQTFKRDTPFVFRKDEPAILLGTDTGANPVEYLLAALAGCLTTSLVYHAAAKGIKVDEVTSTYSGNLDLRGFLGMDPSVRNGYSDINIEFRVKGDATPEQLEELVRVAEQRSPVYDVVSKSVPVTLTVAK